MALFNSESGRLFCFSPLTYFSTLLYLAHPLKALKGDLHKKGKPSCFHPWVFLCVLKSPSENNLRSICRIMLGQNIHHFS